MKAHEQYECKLFNSTSFLNVLLKGEVFNGFVKVIPNFCSCKVNAEFLIVCFDGIDIIGCSIKLNPCVSILQEWLWCLGPFLRARLYFAKKLHGKEGLERTIVRVKSILARHKVEITNSPWRSLPELTNAGGVPCHDGCPAQAWSVSCLLDVLYDMEKLVQGDNTT